jgi:hypothetical protein
VIALGLVPWLPVCTLAVVDEPRAQRVREIVAAHFIGGASAPCEALCRLEDVMRTLDRHSRLVIGPVPDLDFIRGLRAEEREPELIWKGDGRPRIRLPAFGRRTAFHFRELLDRVVGRQPRGLVIDLRGNGGGRLETALAIAECFIPRGAPMIDVIGRSNTRRFASQGPARPPALAVEILVDGETASSAEVLAWLLRRYAHARVSGSATAGKGTVQEVFRVDPGARLVLTTAMYRLPDGSSLERRGIEPDVGEGE